MALGRLVAGTVGATLVLVGIVTAVAASVPAGVPFIVAGAFALGFLIVRRGHGPAPTAPDTFEDDDAPVLEEDVFVLRCASCGTVADVVDTGARPLRHTCPGCGAVGVLPLAAARKSIPVPAARPGQRLKVRCGPCRTVTTIVDDGTRPLAHTCPACGRKGRIEERAEHST